MSSSRNLLRINVGFLLNQPKGTYRDIPLNLPGVRLSPELETGDLRGFVRISRTSEGLLVQGDFSSSTPAVCVRCLVDFSQALHTEFTELYYFPKMVEENTSTGDEPELILPEDGYIDLSPLLREYLLLEIPIKPLCRADCKGLCLDCGANLNQGGCIHTVHTEVGVNQPPGN